MFNQWTRLVCEVEVAVNICNMRAARRARRVRHYARRVLRGFVASGTSSLVADIRLYLFNEPLHTSIKTIKRFNWVSFTEIRWSHLVRLRVYLAMQVTEARPCLCDIAQCLMGSNVLGRSGRTDSRSWEASRCPSGMPVDSWKPLIAARDVCRTSECIPSDYQITLKLERKSNTNAFLKGHVCLASTWR